MKFCTITPDRNDRPEFTEFCHHQLGRMNRKPTASYFINYAPTSADYDLTERVKVGIERAKIDGFDLCFIIENDDYYAPDYFDLIWDAEFIGNAKTWYYNLRNRTYQDWDHPRRASLFTTGFKISALTLFDWPENNERFLDLSLWTFATRARRPVAYREAKAIGMKHGVGLCGGKGHIQRNKYHDGNLECLKENVDSDAYEFYSKLKL